MRSRQRTGLRAVAARAEIGEGVKGVRHPPTAGSIIYDARSVISHLIEMNDLDCSALGFRGMGWIGPRSSLTGRAKRGIFGPFLFLVQIYVF